MAEMRIEDVFADPSGGTAVTGRLMGGPVRRGDTLWLSGADGIGVAVEVRRFLRLCGRQDNEVAHPDENTAIVLDGLPPDLTLIGLTLTSVAQP
ncbi:hypothetical protein [Actinoplanes philippinensis]|uniref:hypothetical protein n=1 Tax=Actinoplanes philippinensis TaxID=35752 RepID=UPI0033C258AE